jgi:multiple sugar transport system permease protein
MSAEADRALVARTDAAGRDPMTRYLDIGGLLLTLATAIFAIIWAFPLYWTAVTTLKPEHEVVRPYVELWPETFTIEAYLHVFQRTSIGIWLLNSAIVSVATTALVVLMGMTCGYAISQLRFPGRMVLWWTILASFMVPIQALIVNHFILMWKVSALNTLFGVVLPQLIVPVVVIVYKQFFDSVPRDFREAAVIDGSSPSSALPAGSESTRFSQASSFSLARHLRSRFLQASSSSSGLHFRRA